MATTKCPVTKGVITALGTTPQERGLETPAFKAKFDQEPDGIIDYINNTLTVEVDAHLVENVAQVGVVYHDASIEGVQKVTIPDFVSKSLSVNAVVANAVGKMSQGFVDKIGTNICTFDASNTGTAGKHSYTTSGAIFIVDSPGNFISGAITLDADGYTITWTKTGTGATGTIVVIHSLITH